MFVKGVDTEELSIEANKKQEVDVYILHSQALKRTVLCSLIYLTWLKQFSARLNFAVLQNDR